ncbi:RagB/SusD family nutrient uptake outer membrane protein [Mucilaginibacter sp. L196]|uniref:RagB/SusD family nutrient uptake outer membrane protein n=1 Tax=Mucilaginibacter sp. L196 TaxID=1641870 RepID=UPI00131B0472|nr:RagB/SusD family nutrient uptake outer membrane protein [Mucilaginibacter sp. L196]
MKRHTINMVLLAGIVAFSITSCKKNLILSPNNEVTSQQVFSTPLGYTQAMAKVYGAFALTGNEGPAGSPDIQGVDEGTSDFFREFWNCEELPTDEAVITYTDPGVQPLHSMSWDATNAISQGLYYRSLYQITLCNNFLQQSTPAMVAKRGITGADATNIAYYAAEARFLRAYQYWVMMDVFGNPPFATDATTIGSTIPPQITRKNLYAYIVSELKAIDPLMVKPNQNLYGRADEAAVWALLARVYLNAAVYTGTADYADAATYASKVIGTSNYGLISNFQNLMLADDSLNTVSGGGKISEFILTINYNGTKSETYGGSQYLTHAPVGGSMPPDLFGISGGYDGSRTTSNIISLFPAPATTDGSQFPSNGNADSRAQFWYPGQSATINNVLTFTDGIAVTKFRNVTSTGAQGSSNTYSDVDLPLFRVPEMYLIYAEAALNGAAGTDQGTALNYVNLIRERAYGGHAGDIVAAQLTLQFILDERARELFWEGFRRTDLIRYGLFTSSTYLWPFKGGVANGTGVASYRNLFPLPATDLAANPNLKQNPGY